MEERYLYGRRWTAAIMVVAAVLFVWFYPVYTGITISRVWMNLAMRWLPSWGF
jgi:dolichyl-phosphate-mannose-protein mannosyltransferase